MSPRIWFDVDGVLAQFTHLYLGLEREGSLWRLLKRVYAYGMDDVLRSHFRDTQAFLRVALTEPSRRNT